MTKKEKVALISVFASTVLTLSKAIIGLLTGSLGIISEAGHSFLDLLATLMTYFAVRISDKPADEEHHFGHAKVESVTALIETGLLFVLSFLVLWKAGSYILFGSAHEVTLSVWAFAVILMSIAIDFSRARALTKVAHETSSHALEADALHYSSDMWSSMAVLAGLVGVAIGYPIADTIAAIAVAVFICIAGWRLGKRTIDTLVDRAPEGAGEHIREAIGRVKGVIAIDFIRVRPAGDALFVETEVAVNRTLPLDRVTIIRERVSAAVVSVFPKANVLVTTSPRALDDESVMERVMVIARNKALAVHHVTVHTIGDRLSISLDLEVDGRETLDAAHRTASDLEEAIQQELGEAAEVETHIEPLEPNDALGRDLGPARGEDIRKILDALAREIGTISHIHDVRVRDTDDGEIVNFHCDADGTLTVQQVHERVDGLERALRERVPAVKRVIGHAEPRA